MGHWTPMGIEPTDYEDDDELTKFSFLAQIINEMDFTSVVDF